MLQPVVYVVEDDLVLVKLYREILKTGEFQLQVFESAEEFVRAYDPTRPACLILDLEMPGMGGLALLEWIQRSGHVVPAIVVSSTDKVPDAIRAMKGGAVDFIRKPFQRDHLLQNLNTLLSKGRTEFRLAAERTALRRRHDSLSPREKQVMGHVVGGFSNREIADQLGISERTVEVHRSKVMVKMEATSVADLVEQAVALRSAGDSKSEPSPG